MKVALCVIDCGVGNTCSVTNALSSLGFEATVSCDWEQIRRSDILLLPGVGSFDVAMKNLRAKELDKVLAEEVLGKEKPILGICLGMQMFATNSEENGDCEGLNWIPGAVKKMIPEGLPVPHVGWNNVQIVQARPLFSKSTADSHFYFDHSYQYECDDCYVTAYTDYGMRVIAAVQRDNIYGVQFHPEKSQTNGLKLFRSFFSFFKSENRDAKKENNCVLTRL